MEAEKLNEIPTVSAESTIEEQPDEMETPAETAQEESTPNGELIEYINRFAPDSDSSTPEGLLAGATKIIHDMVPIYDKVYDVSIGSPEAAAFMNDLLETGDVAKSLARNYDPEELKALWEEVSGEDNEEDRNSFSEKVKSTKDRADYLKGNQDISIAEISAFYEEKGWSEEQADEFSQKVDEFATDLFDGKITKDHLTKLEKAFNYDGDLATAEENGKIIGKNEKIVTGKKTREDLKNELPEMGTASMPRPKDKSFGAKFMDGVF